VILFEMVTGRLPYQAAEIHRIMEEIREGPAPDPAALRPDLPAPMAALIRNCLERDRDQRPRSAQEILEALEAAVPCP